MSKPIATNNYVWIIRDATETEKAGLILPSSGKVKPHTGEIFSSGTIIKDGKIKSGVGKKAIFHKGIGQTIEFDGQEYLILEDHQIIGIL